MVILYLPETHHLIILDRKAKRLRAEGEIVASPMDTGHSAKTILAQYLSRPFKVVLSNCLTLDVVPESNRPRNELVIPQIDSNNRMMALMYSFIYLLYSTYIPRVS
jgi:hypothetical protein